MRRERPQPVHVAIGEPSWSAPTPPLRIQLAAKLREPPPTSMSVVPNSRIPEPQHLVVAEDDDDLALRLRGLVLHRHEELDHAEPVRAAVDQVTEHEESRTAPGPRAALVDEPGIHQGGAQPVEVAVHVAGDEQARGVPAFAVHAEPAPPVTRIVMREP